MARSIQLTLTRPEWFRPVPDGDRHYVPVLQNKPGELSAFLHATAEVWERMTPLIVILGPKRREEEPFKLGRVDTWIKKVADAVGDNPCFLDALRVRTTDRVATAAGPSPVLEAVHERARSRGMRFVPVLRVGDPVPTRAQLRSAVECDGRGVAIRYPILGSASADGRGPQTLVKEALEAVGVDVAGADLLLDLGFIDPEIEIDAADLETAIDELVAVGAWRSVVLLGTGMHRSLGGGVVQEGTVGRLPRREWDLWWALRAARPRRLPTYGDYAVQHPDPPWDGEESGPGMRANVRYTLAGSTVVPRGRGPFQQEGAEQYRRLCDQIVAEPGFSGGAYSWGDALILDCARGSGDPGNQNRWRGAGTSHHLRLVVEQLGTLR